MANKRLRSDLRRFPLAAMHAHAQEAALASEAAVFQGRFGEMHDLLYREQAIWSKTDDVRELFNGYAAMIGLNLDAALKPRSVP
jgi:protein-disulfide isomerase